MSETYFRIQTADRDVDDLLDPAGQISRYWGREDRDQDGVSVCDSIEDLAAYLAGPGAGIPYGVGNWVIVEVAGDYLGRGHDDGESLIRPTEIISVEPMGDDMFDLIGAAYDALEA